MCHPIANEVVTQKGYVRTYEIATFQNEPIRGDQDPESNGDYALDHGVLETTDG
jgi:hypothetical protein